MRLLQVGQAEMQGFGLSICSFDRPTFTTIRRWAEVFAVLRNLSALDGISVNAMRMHTSPCVAHMLREFLGPKMADVSLFPSPDFLALAPCFGSTALRQVRTYYISERQPLE
ncbi:hypothetical protein M3Y99_00334900 [Aphelenchoides fujianensis]|nr:hypothetical protein M3Y99_00334900 [Aphelenchoides fujianensis]